VLLSYSPLNLLTSWSHLFQNLYIGLNVSNSPHFCHKLFTASEPYMFVCVSFYQPVWFLINTCSSSLIYFARRTSLLVVENNKSLFFIYASPLSVGLNVINFLVHLGSLSRSIFYHIYFITDTTQSIIAVTTFISETQSHYASFLTLRSFIRGLKRICLHLPLGL